MITSELKVKESDKCICAKESIHDYGIQFLYVDDILIMVSNDNIVKRKKVTLNSNSDMKDTSLADVILGIKIKKTSEALIFRQTRYINKILELFIKDDNGIASTPL